MKNFLRNIKFNFNCGVFISLIFGFYGEYFLRELYKSLEIHQ